MSTAQKIAKEYFKLSNQSDFDSIAKLFTDQTTYSSQNTGIYLGSKDILKMQKEFHVKFTSLEWQVNSVEEVKPGIVLFDFDFVVQTVNGEAIESAGYEYVVVEDEKIVHIEIRNKE